MASPQIEDGHTKISNELMDALCGMRIPGEARQVLDVIFRKTYGWNKIWDSISLSQFIALTKIKKPNVVRAIRMLFDMNIIVIKKDSVIEIDNKSLSKKITQTTKYCIQKDYEKWRPLSKKITVIEKDNKSLSKKIPTKAITKASKDIMSDSGKSDEKNGTVVEQKTEPPPPIVPPEEEPPKGKKKVFTDEDLDLACLLDQRIHENFPSVKETTQSSRETWANEFRMMRTVDKKTHDEISELIEFSQHDDFWKDNILSGGKLRKQQNALIAKMAKNKNKTKKDTPQRTYIHLPPEEEVVK